MAQDSLDIILAVLPPDPIAYPLGADEGTPDPEKLEAWLADPANWKVGVIHTYQAGTPVGGERASLPPLSKGGFYVIFEGSAKADEHGIPQTLKRTADFTP